MRNRPGPWRRSYRGSGRLAGKTGLITAGDSGIRRALAIAFARKGADVAVVYPPEEERNLQEAVRWIEAAGRKSFW